MYHAILDKLESSSLIHSINTHSEISENTWNTWAYPEKTSPQTQYYTGSGTKFKSYSPYKNISSNPNQFKISDAIYFTKDILEYTSSNNDTILQPSQNHIFETGDLHYTKLWKIVGQAFHSYIIVEKDDKILMFDQHALAERIIYEKLVKKETKKTSQTLLIPENIKLTPSESSFLEEKRDVFQEMWFEIEFLSNNILSIGSIPDFIKKENIKDIVLWIIKDITEGNILKSNTLEEVKNKIYAYTACRSAIKFWNKLNLFEMNKLLNDAVDWYSSTCPHGRPVIFELSLDELKNKYER